jgi:ricin-type beta-trefoil lectin protein
MRSSTILPATLALLAACDAGFDTASQSQRLTGGTVLSDNVAPFDSVTLLNTFPGGPSFCATTKIGAHRFLTSASCIDYYPVETTITLSNRLDGIDGAGSNAIATKVVAFYRHPTFDLGTAGTGLVTMRRGYDLAIIDILADTPTIPVLPVRTGYVAPGTPGVVVGFGCQALPPDPSGADANTDWFAWEKQFASVTTAGLDVLRAEVTWTDAQVTSSYTSYAIAPGALQPCHGGDRGGPLLVQDAGGAWQIAGVISDNSDAELSWFARVGGTSRWISSPTLNAFGDVSWGWLINGKSDLCLGDASNGITGQNFCDGANLNTDAQVWRVRDAGGGYQLRNGKTGQCLSVDSLANGTPLVQVACAPSITDASLGQEWKLQPVAGDKLRIVNSKSGRCIGVPGASNAPGVAVAQFTCNGAASQGWIFSH